MNLPPPSGEMPCYPPPAFSGREFSASAAADPTELTITRPLLEEALAAKPALAALSTEEKKAVLLSMADALEADTPPFWRPTPWTWPRPRTPSPR